jgi:hypothetical protein
VKAMSDSVIRIDWLYEHGGGTSVATEWRIHDCGRLNLCCALGASRITITPVSMRDAVQLLREDIARVATSAPEIVAALNRLVHAHGNNDRFKHIDMMHCADCRRHCTGNPDCLCGCDKD